MAGFWMGEKTQEQINLWLTRSLVLVSFAAHLTLALLAGIRRRRHSGVMRFLVWLAYHVTEIGMPIALGKVFLDTANADGDQQLKLLVNPATAYREQQMFALWAPFLLLHLGRPDNNTSYALVNKGLSLTQKVAVVLGIGGATYGSYKQRFTRGDGALCAAFFTMLFLGSYKYVERAVALHRASFDNIRRSNKKKFLRLLTFEDEDRKWDNDDALLDAHGLLGVTMGAFAEYQVNPGGYRRSYSCWKDVSKVVEMEASLMYDMLYTKASVIHNWDGYMIRLVSPPATATAFYLFYHKEGMAMDSADRMVTYILLVGTLWLDVSWLLRALGSTWAYVFLADTEQAFEEEESKQVLLPVRRTFSDNLPRPGWLKQVGCRRAVRQSWYWLRRLLVSLDPFQLAQRSGQSGHRLLPDSGIGQCNLLQQCSTSPQGRLGKLVSCFSAGIGKKKIDVKDKLLEVMCRYLVVDLGIIVGMHPTRKLADYMRSNADCCSLETTLIALHVATGIFLLCRPTLPGIESEESAKYEKTIRALSDYMMFLLAERRHVVLKPGDEGGHYEKVRLDLVEIWREEGTSGSHTISDTKLANILLKMNATEGRWLTVHGQYGLLFERSITLALGADWAFKLLHQLDPATDYGRPIHPMRGQYIHKLEIKIMTSFFFSFFKKKKRPPP